MAALICHFPAAFALHRRHSRYRRCAGQQRQRKQDRRKKVDTDFAEPFQHV